MLRDFDYEKLTYEDRKGIHDALAETTLKHIDASNGLFEHLDFNPAAHPSQILETTHLEPVPVAEGETAALATAARPDMFNHARDVLAKQPAFTSAARILLYQHGVNIFPVTNHGTIEDIAVWSAAWLEHLDEETWPDQNGLVISRGVTTIGAFGMAASEVVEKAGHVFMSFPRTPTIDNLGFDDSLISTNNRAMRREVHSWLGEDLVHKVLRRKIGKTLNIAWSGKTDTVKYGDDHKPERIIMGGISNGTLDIVKRGLVLPITIWEGDEPFIEIGELTKVSTPQDALKVQQWQQHELAKTLGISVENVEINQNQTAAINNTNSPRAIR